MKLVIRNRRGITEWLPQAHMDAVLAMNEQAMDRLNDVMKGVALGNKKLKYTKLKPGEVKCTASCFSGELLYLDSSVDCKVCKKGKFKCKQCKKGELGCVHCSRRGKLDDACEDCAGTGSVPSTAKTPFDTCPWCKGTEERACGSCSLPSTPLLACWVCVGEGKVACRKCRGAAKLPCSTCGGRGKHGPSKTKCETCRQKGTTPCGDCTEGLVDCIPCGGKGINHPTCFSCRGTKKHGCNGCGFDAYLAWERTAEWALQAGELAAAEKWLAHGRKRCELRYRNYIAKSNKDPSKPLDPTFEAAILEEMENELARLDKLARKIKIAK